MITYILDVLEWGPYSTSKWGCSEERHMHRSGLRRKVWVGHVVIGRADDKAEGKGRPWIEDLRHIPEEGQRQPLRRMTVFHVPY